MLLFRFGQYISCAEDVSRHDVRAAQSGQPLLVLTATKSFSRISSKAQHPQLTVVGVAALIDLPSTSQTKNQNSQTTAGLGNITINPPWSVSQLL